jgi:hypothetical protein
VLTHCASLRNIPLRTKRLSHVYKLLEISYGQVKIASCVVRKISIVYMLVIDLAKYPYFYAGKMKAGYMSIAFHDTPIFRSLTGNVMSSENF